LSGRRATDVAKKRSILRRTDANCCPSGGFRYRFLGWDGAKFVVTERRTVRRRSRRGGGGCTAAASLTETGGSFSSREGRKDLESLSADRAGHGQDARTTYGGGRGSRT